MVHIAGSQGRRSGRPALRRGAGPQSGELAEVRAQLREAPETIEAIRGGGVDSLVIGPPGQEQVYSLASADRTYRLLVEAMSEGAATVSPRGVILDANPRLGAMTGQRRHGTGRYRGARPGPRRAAAPSWPGCSMSAPATAPAARWS